MRFRLLVPAALVLTPLSMHAQAAQPVRDSIVSASETRSSRIVPDQASLYIIVEGSAETATDAVARVETKLKAVSDALKGYGSHLEVDRPIAYSVGATPAPNGYPGAATPPTNLARSVIRVQLIKPAELSHVVAAALNAGAATSSALTFESSVADSVRRVRTAEALAAARTNADAMAKALGGRLGSLVEVSTAGAGPTNFPQNFSLDNRVFTQSVAPEVVVSASVTVRYRLIH